MKLVDNIDDQSSTKFYRVYVCTFGFRNSWKRQKLWVLRIYGIYTGEGKMAEITRQLEETGSETQKGKAWCLEEMVRRNMGFERNNFWRDTTVGCGRHQKPGNRDWRTGVLLPLPPRWFSGLGSGISFNWAWVHWLSAEDKSSAFVLYLWELNETNCT